MAYLGESGKNSIFGREIRQRSAKINIAIAIHVSPA